jgi:hypothetical protein
MKGYEMLGRLFGSPKKRRAEEVMKSLTAKAVEHVSEPSFERNNAFIRAYAVALGITIPEHVTSAAFPGKLYPKWDDVVWRKPDSIFDDLAALLAWRQCLAAFSDVEDIFKPERQKWAKETLMRVCGNTFSYSERAERLTHRYHAFLTDRTARQELLDKQYIGPIDFEEPSQILIHAWMVNEALEEPDLNLREDSAAIYGLIFYLSDLETNATIYFKNRARDIFEKHLAAGRP